MSSETTWHTRPTLVADWELWMVYEGDLPVADFCSKEDADQIVADHNAAKNLELAKAALQRIASGWKYPPGNGMRPPPEPLGRDGMRRIASETIELLSPVNTTGDQGATQ